MRVGETLQISAPPQRVWESISDPGRYLDFMSGVTRWEVVSDKRDGIGARYRMLIRVGSAEVGGLIEVVEFSPPGDLAWTSITGIDQRGRWRIRELPNDRSRVEFRLQFGVAGAGLTGWLAEQVAAPVMRDHVRRSLRTLKRQVEHEQMRAKAAERRAARAAGSRTS